MMGARTSSEGIDRTPRTALIFLALDGEVKSAQSYRIDLVGPVDGAAIGRAHYLASEMIGPCVLMRTRAA